MTEFHCKPCSILTTSSKWFVCESGRCFDLLSPADTNPVKADDTAATVGERGVYEMRPNSRGTFRATESTQLWSVECIRKENSKLGELQMILQIKTRCWVSICSEAQSINAPKARQKVVPPIIEGITQKSNLPLRMWPD